jgi:ribosomal protein L13
MRSEKTKQMLSNRRKSKEMIESLKIIKGDSNNENVKDDGKRMSRGLSVV